MSRLTLMDALHAWALFFALFLFLTSSFKWSFVISIFAVANAAIIACWLAVSAPDPTRTADFISGLRVGAHRGLASDAPENTLAAFRLAPQLGADTVELDLEFSKDGVPVVFHDDTLERVTDGRGRISDTTAADLFRLNAAAKFRNTTHEGIPTLEDAIHLLLELNLRILIDVKNPHHLVTETLVSLFQRNKELYNCAAVCSFFPQVVYDIKRVDPNILTGHTWRPGFFAYKDIEMTDRRYPESGLMHLAAVIGDWVNEVVLHSWLWKFTGATLLLAHRAVISESYVQKWTDKGLQVVLHSWLWKFTGATLLLAHRAVISESYVQTWTDKGLQVVAWTSNSVAERTYFLRDLRVPILTDCLSDFQDEMRSLREEETNLDDASSS